MLSDDVLPQPFRFINKLVNRCVDDAFEVIRRKALAENAHRRFNPPRSLHVHSSDEVPLVLSASDTPETGAAGPLRPAEPTATYRGRTNLAFGFKTGRVVVHATETGEALGVFNVSDEPEPVTAVAATDAHCVFAAAAGKNVTLFYGLSEEAQRALRPSDAEQAAAAAAADEALDDAAADVDGPGNDLQRPVSRMTTGGSEVLPSTISLAQWCTVSSDLVPGIATAGVQALTLSDDATHLAITTGACPPEVVCVRLPDPSAVLRGDVLLPGGNDSAVTDASSSMKTLASEPIVVFTATVPEDVTLPSPPEKANKGRPQSQPAASAPTATVTIAALCAFMCENAETARLNDRVRPHRFSCHRGPAPLPLAHTMCVAWTGTNFFSTYALGAAPTIAPPPPLAVVAPTVAHVPQVDVVAPVHSNAKGAKGKEKEKKEDKSADAGTGDAQGSAGGGAFPAVSVGPSGFTPGVPATPFDLKPTRERHHALTQFVTTAAKCPGTARDDLFVVGCCDGLIAVWSALRASTLHLINDAPHRLRQCPVRPMIVTNLAFYRGTHVVAALSIPAGAPSRAATDHSRVVVYELETGEAVCSVDFVPRLSWVACFSQLPVFLFNTDGRVFAADVFSGALVAQIDQAVLGASRVVPKTTDLALLLEHTVAVATTDGVAFGETGLAIVADATNDSGEKRKRVYHLDASQLIAVAYPVIDQVYHRATVDQLAYVLRRLPDAADRHRMEVVVAQQPPGTIHHDHQQRKGSGTAAAMSGSMAAALGPLRTRASSFGGSTRAADTPGSTVRPLPTKSIAARSAAGSRTGTAETTSKRDGLAGGAPAMAIVSGPQTAAQRVQSVIDSRVATKAQREQRFKALWQSMQP